MAGNPGMASGGMGDVLTGVIASLVAQGLTLQNAATCGVYLHATAGDLAAKQGEIGMLASDLFPFLRSLVNNFRA
jgi:NAD(P)H-hydrate epimerase